MTPQPRSFRISVFELLSAFGIRAYDVALNHLQSIGLTSRFGLVARGPPIRVSLLRRQDGQRGLLQRRSLRLANALAPATRGHAKQRSDRNRDSRIRLFRRGPAPSAAACSA